MSRSSSRILVTGGAGYIGSHVVRQLVERGDPVVVLDNLSTGYRSAVLDAPLVVGHTGDSELVARVLKEHDVDTVLHFAAHTIVPESVSNPLKYYGNNTCATRNLLEQCAHAKVRRFVFSSTAAVYGIPAEGLAREDSPTVPINPYGLSKLMSEWMLRDLAAASDTLRYVALRYFNVAGSDPGGRIGHSAPTATLLVKVACQVAAGARANVSIFGTDYPTPDGTGVRDYIHVEDLAAAHLRALDYLGQGGVSLERSSMSSRRRAVRATRPRWSRTPSGSGRCSTGPRATTTSRRSSARSSNGNTGCSASRTSCATEMGSQLKWGQTPVKGKLTGV
jgi:UDP-glucose 4-epimerase